MGHISIAALLLTSFIANSAYGYTSNDPVVKSMIDQGIKRLEKDLKTATHYPVGVFHSGGTGEHSLAGYAMMKLTHDPANPVVQRGIQSSLLFVRSMSGRDPGGANSKTVYSAAVATLLLAEVDKMKYRKELNSLESYFRRVQFRNGGYGYAGTQKGDVSQTQYAILALWTLDNAGIVIDYDGIAKTMQWLLRVQDISGAWPYQGIDPPGDARIRQTIEVGLSMAYAGGSALLIAADILQLWDAESEASLLKGMPRSVRLYEEGMENLAVRRPKFPVDKVRASIKDCDAYIAKHGDGHVAWPYYCIYTTERYESFREIAFNLPKNAPAKWYDEGVDFLKGKQANGGGWTGTSQFVTASTASSFAVLFLSRSTQHAIEQAAEGYLTGGQGLPGDTTKIRVEGSQIKGEPVAEAVTDLLDMLEGDDANSLEDKSLPENMKLATDPKARRAQLDRLERLVRGSSSWQARRVAARLLGQSDEIRVVPSLIFALDDQDTTVRTFARDGLRFISRKFEGFGMKIEPGEKQDYGEVRRAQRLWREWYLTMDPGYIFLAE
ncbi:hypothetical protein [Aporhodopirellula aestuarii]|uniref:Squalene cyclase C-terminal domain-containing protein n=1 Tax=Aporhodopirellula aestuarii TaxID=2950107 RepID=A0ABT0U3N5_9BACT|nr:hypothetical protein [Aporhodopirellula aestuarii]MCM2371518.1 hypothetical protein [Aporhodopirellula aestuarii]